MNSRVRARHRISTAVDGALYELERDNREAWQQVDRLRAECERLTKEAEKMSEHHERQRAIRVVVGEQWLFMCALLCAAHGMPREGNVVEHCRWVEDPECWDSRAWSMLRAVAVPLNDIDVNHSVMVADIKAGRRLPCAVDVVDGAA